MKDYRRIRNKTLSTQRKEKNIWARGLFAEEKLEIKTIWSAVNTLKGKGKNSGIGRLTDEGISKDKPQEIADCLNTFFGEKIRKLKCKMPAPSKNLVDELAKLEPSEQDKQQLYEVDIDKIRRYVKEQKKSTANGVDSINSIVLKDALPKIENQLTHLANLSLCEGVFPTCFKTTKIVPILKQGKDKEEPGSYRPVANLCQIGKIIERAAFDQIMGYIHSRNLINHNQHGGRKSHSTATCVLEILQETERAKKDKRKAALDMSAAYDLVDHNLFQQQL